VPLDVHVPIFSEIVPGGFRHSADYLVEFAPNSMWYEASLTIAARALKAGVRTQYHTFMHVPVEIRQDLHKLGADLKKLESEDKFRLIDRYTGLNALPVQPEPGRMIAGRPRLPNFTLNDPSFSEKFTSEIVTTLTEGAIETDKRWLRIDDNTSIINRYFEEKDVLNIFQTRVFQLTRLFELSAFHSVVAGVWSESFYKQLEAQCDGVIDFKVEEDEGQLEHFVRIKSLRGKSFDSRWRPLRLEATGEVVLEKVGEGKKKEIGISGWIKGPKKK
jgi:KaiC/GvpD/RAD55 family RecA-like ATPase